ncbi:MAG: alpha/beta fold hydrolase [Burkholderiales bacterium]|nr:alpha/beta fold hydrolase [Burkholderiales bacterium]
MKSICNGVGIHYEIEGEGPWVVMSHSLACNLHMWDDQAKTLAARYGVLRFDTRGHGSSDAPVTAYTLEQMADDVKALLDTVGVKDPHFVGLSMGGMIGMTFALKYPGVLRSLVLCDTTSRYPAEARGIWTDRIKLATDQGMEPLVQPTLKRWFTEPYLAKGGPVVEKVAQMIRSTPAMGYVGCCHAIPMIDVTSRLAEIKCPIQVIVGEQDAGTPVAMAQEIHHAAPNSELVIIPDASHLSNMEQPQAFDKAMTGFLARS